MSPKFVTSKFSYNWNIEKWNSIRALTSRFLVWRANFFCFRRWGHMTSYQNVWNGDADLVRATKNSWRAMPRAKIGKTTQNLLFLSVIFTVGPIDALICFSFWSYEHTINYENVLKKYLKNAVFRPKSAKVWESLLRGGGSKFGWKFWQKWPKNGHFWIKNWPFFSQSPLEPILSPKKFWRSHDQFRPIFRQNGEGCDLILPQNRL